ncbi:MAG: LamG domain-containing protein [Candidatus Aenigmarchaeota archaeon]|nr:LamG domain-containing protein [Candidatus Aenigmarchaeota archaeon]
MQGISAIIAVVLILLITVSLASAGYLFFSSIFSQTTSTASSGISQITTGMSQNFVIEAVSGKQITIRNTGQTPITNFAIYVDEKPVNFTNSSKIVNPGEIYTFFVYDFIDYSYPRTLKITIPGVVQTKQVGKENSDPSLVGYWKFDEGSGTIAYDSSIYGNDGILVGGSNVSWNTGQYCKYNSCLTFSNGTGNGNKGGGMVNISYSKSFGVLKSISIEVWIKNSTSGTFGIIERSNGGCNLNNPFEIFISSYAYFRISNSTTCNQIDSNTPISLNQWYYIAGIYNKSMMILYVNDSFITKLHSGDIIERVSPLTIGATNDGAWSFNGTIDEVRVWNRPLTPEEVLNHYLHGPI